MIFLRDHRFWEAAIRINSFLAWIPTILLLGGAWIFFYGDPLDSYVANGGLQVANGVEGGPSPSVIDNVVFYRPITAHWETTIRHNVDGFMVAYVAAGEKDPCRAHGESAFPLAQEEPRPASVEWVLEFKTCSKNLPAGQYALEWDYDFSGRVGRPLSFAARSNVFTIAPKRGS
jgi:hypothetical protein